jgi:hypothetical protein
VFTACTASILAFAARAYSGFILGSVDSNTDTPSDLDEPMWRPSARRSGVLARGQLFLSVINNRESSHGERPQRHHHSENAGHHI